MKNFKDSRIHFISFKTMSILFIVDFLFLFLFLFFNTKNTNDVFVMYITYFSTLYIFSILSIYIYNYQKIYRKCFYSKKSFIVGYYQVEINKPTIKIKNLRTEQVSHFEIANTKLYKNKDNFSLYSGNHTLLTYKGKDALKIYMLFQKSFV